MSRFHNPLIVLILFLRKALNPFVLPFAHDGLAAPFIPSSDPIPQDDADSDSINDQDALDSGRFTPQPGRRTGVGHGHGLPNDGDASASEPSNGAGHFDLDTDSELESDTTFHKHRRDSRDSDSELELEETESSDDSD